MTLLGASHHIQSTIRMADRLLMLLDGRGISGTPAELIPGGEKRVLEFLEEGAPAEIARPVAAGGMA